MRNTISTDEYVENKDRRFGQATGYYPCMIDRGSDSVPALFTVDQVRDAMSRAGSNPEDLPGIYRYGHLGAFLRWLAGLFRSR